MGVAEWRIAGFDEVRELGRGGQGRVVLARHATAGTPVAIKYLPAEAAPEARERLRQEARMLGTVTDPHVARLYRLVDSEHGVAIVMEAVDGVSFKEILARHGTLAPEAALTVLKGSLLGLAAAHAVGVVHRDYKPANVVVPADGRSKLIDFGIAGHAGQAAREGTPFYMAPEQWRGEPASPATDVYAATCVFFEAITGRRPYTGGQATLESAHRTEPVPAEAVPEPLRPLIVRGMAKDPWDRPEGAAAFVTELEDVAAQAYGAGWEARGVRLLAGATLALAALFPLAAGLAPAAGAGAGAAATGTTGVLAAVGTKTAVAVAGAAVVGSAATGVGVYEAARPDHAPGRVSPAVSTTPPGRPMTLARLRLSVPLGWTSRRFRPSGESFGITVPGRCRKALTRVSGTACPGFEVLDRDSMGWGGTELNDGTYKRGQYFNPVNDISGFCPVDPEKYLSTRPERLVKKGLAPVGNRQAEYYEWQVRCYEFRANGAGLIRSNVTFIQRTWFLPRSVILIVDDWNVKELPGVLARATWI
ncbi:hypothetical protein GCM10023085_64410 [Actinomadura viridis]|uniref:non-specific serine/threonine protein kinase n=1 Tax=Actinomadura viridis TaxID=58110 RepID=A0A931GRR5_9ACTN|nr:serine/threonine-protein kinase [Actinomadura viridis]MBG6093141.1 hypothetical protein [Actinomadura viridis]